MATTGTYQAPQPVQPGLEAVDERQKQQYVNSYGPEVAPNPPRYESGVPQQQQSKRNPFGLSPLLFGLLVGAITAIIMGAALGGGIGGALASCQSQKSKLQASTGGTSPAAQSAGVTGSALTAGFSSQASSTASATSAASSASATGITNYAPTPIRNVSTVALDCPAIDGTTVKNHFNQNYKYTCGIDLGHQPSAAGGNITDIAAIVAYTIEDCIDACSAITFQTYIEGISGGPTCSSVSFFANVQASVSVGNGNCWLKNGTLAAGASGNAASDSVSAQLTN